MSSARLKQGAFVALLLIALIPPVPAAAALVAGLVFALTVGNPFAARSKRWATNALQVSVVGLGFGMNLREVLQTGLAGAAQTLVGLSVTLALAALLQRLMRTEATTTLLIAVGTAICGGSAIAAVAPAVGAKSHQTSIALAVVFMLNAVALLVFPFIGHTLTMRPEAFGLWSALAIHDTSSVVGASLQFGPEALHVGTTVKLTRALWIVPVTLVLARVWPRQPDATASTARPNRPWFIVGFIAAAALVSFVPELASLGGYAASGARRLLVATLFLVGANVSRESLVSVGARPLVLGVMLWVVVASASLWWVLTQ